MTAQLTEIHEEYKEWKVEDQKQRRNERARERYAEKRAEQMRRERLRG